MTVKEYLRDIRKYETLIRCKTAQLDKMRALVEYHGTAMGDDPRVPSDPSSSRTDSLVRLAALSEELDATIREMQEHRRHAMEMIDSLSDPQMVRIFYARYLDGKAWKEIADEMNVSIQWIFRLHGNGLSELSRRYQAVS